MTALSKTSSVFIAVGVVLLVGALNAPATAQSSEQPNIIFILTDDQGAESISALDGSNEIFGNEMGCETPTMNQLAQLGVSFTNCRVNPNCSPTRAGLLTGRRALGTGVTGVIAHYNESGDRGIDPCASDPELSLLTGDLAKATDLLSLQTYERTIAEALQDAGYYTILVDKWHVGGDHVSVAQEGEDRGLTPDDQGFNTVLDWKDYVCLDDPDDDTDLDHMARMADLAYQAADAVDNQPYALFFHTISPHRRATDSGGSHWYKVDDDLIPETLNLTGGPPETIRFIQNVEAIDTVIRTELLFPLEVITSQNLPFEYDEESEEPTVVFLLGDNGTDKLVSWYNEESQFGSGHAKNSAYEGGVRVPCIVFGEKISNDLSLPGTVDHRLLSHLDFFDTLADVGGVTAQQRDNLHGFERQGHSFAGGIGWNETDTNIHQTLSFLGLEEPHQARVAFVVEDEGDIFKLIARGTSVGFANPNMDELYLLADSNGPVDPHEFDDWMVEGMSRGAINWYYEMRDMLVDHWPLAVVDAAEPLISIPDYTTDLYGWSSAPELYVLVVLVEYGELTSSSHDEFYNVSTDPNRYTNLLPDLQGEELELYQNLRDEAEDLWSEDSLGATADVAFIDIPVDATMVVSDPSGEYTGSDLAVGHENVGENDEAEHRSLIKFDIDAVDSLIPPEFSLDDAIRAQIIVGFKHDSMKFTDSPSNYWAHDAPTGRINVYPVESHWMSAGIFNAIDDEKDLGHVELPAHVIVGTSIAIGTNEKFRETPMPTGTPVSFGHALKPNGIDSDLLDLFFLWYDEETPNYGVALVAEPLASDPNAPYPIEDQQVYFLNGVDKAYLRLTLDRDP